MGRPFLIVKDEPAYTCATCNAQIALPHPLMDDWLGYFEFFEAYNVSVAEDSEPVSYCEYLYWGYEVSCLNCSSVIGWRDTDGLLFRFEHGRIVPPQVNPAPPQNPPPPVNPAPQEYPPLPEGSPPPIPPPPSDPAPEDDQP